MGNQVFASSGLWDYLTGLCCWQTSSSEDAVGGVKGAFVRNVRVITKGRRTERITPCGEDVPSSTYTITVMRRLQDFTERLLFILKLKGRSVVHAFHENMAISWTGYLYQKECLCSQERRDQLQWEWGPKEVHTSSRSLTDGLSWRAWLVWKTAPITGRHPLGSRNKLAVLASTPTSAVCLPPVQ